MARKLFVLLAACLTLLYFLRPEAGQRVGSEEQNPAIASSSPGIIVVDLQDGADEEDILALEAAYGIDLDYTSPLSHDEALLRGMVSNPAQVLAALEGNPLVEAAEPLIEVEAFGFPNDPMFSKQWNLKAIAAPAAWTLSRGEGIKVGVIDTGVSPVEDLAEGMLLEGASFVPGVKSAADDHGHGTHVAGTIAQVTNNGKGVAGVAFDATIVPYKVLSASGMGSHDWVASAIDQAADDGCDVINLSLGSSRYSKVVALAVKKAQERGVVVVAAAGNTGRRGVSYPAALKDVVAVSALGPNKRLAPYSSYGKGIELAAPGGDLRMGAGSGILQDTIDGRGGHAYREFQGTSMASPHVAGAVAVMMGMGLSGEASLDALYTSAIGTKITPIGEKYGHGFLNLATATQLVQFKYFGTRFFVAGLLGTLMALFIVPSFGTAMVVGVGAALTAGGLFYLPLADFALGVFPDAPGRLVPLLTRGVLEWPAALGAPWLVHFPLWASALLPLGAVFLLGPWRLSGPIAASIALGFGVSLIYAAMGSTVDVMYLGDTLGNVWLWGNGLASILGGMAVLGVRRQAAQSNAAERS